MKTPPLVLVMVLLALSCANNRAEAQALPRPALPHELWSRGANSIWAVRCPHGDVSDGCTSIEVRKGKRSTVIGDGGYWSASVLWKQLKPAVGPDVLVVGEYGGSGGAHDIFAINFAGPRLFTEISAVYGSVPEINTALDRPSFEFRYSIVGFNRASWAETTVVRVPMHWGRGKFEMDLSKLLANAPTPAELARKRPLIEHELATTLESDTTDSTSLTAETLLRLILSGHAGQAHQFLRQVWRPGSHRYLGSDDFWGEFCLYVVSDPNWKVLGLSRIPQTPLVEAAARRYLRIERHILSVQGVH